jgi:hypothetical protein
MTKRVAINNHVCTVEPYVRLQLQCKKCFKFAHVKDKRPSPLLCTRCGQDFTNGHHENCSPKCVNCQNDHWSTDRKCPYFQQMKRGALSQIKLKESKITTIASTNDIQNGFYRNYSAATASNNNNDNFNKIMDERDKKITAAIMQNLDKQVEQSFVCTLDERPSVFFERQTAALTSNFKVSISSEIAINNSRMLGAMNETLTAILNRQVNETNITSHLINSFKNQNMQLAALPQTQLLNLPQQLNNHQPVLYSQEIIKLQQVQQAQQQSHHLSPQQAQIPTA